MLVPGALIVVLGFSNGGYFPGATGVVAIGFIVALVLRVTSAERPLAGLSRSYVAGAVLLALLAVWTLASGSWSDADGRAVIEYGRVLLYLLAFVTLGALGHRPDRLRWMLRGLAAGAAFVCVCALITRCLPDVWHVDPGVANDRLSYPLSYWNALGLLAALGIVFCAALSADDREHPATRAAATAVLPLLAATLLLTFSRASIVLAALGVVVLLAAGRPRYALTALLTGLPAVALAAVLAYDADLLASLDPTSSAATDQGHKLAAALAVIAVVAGLARLALTRFDERIRTGVPRVPVPPVLRRPAVAATAIAGAVALVVAVGLAAGAGHTVHRQYDRFVQGDQVQTGNDRRSRLTQVGNNGRIRQWRVSLRHSYTAHKVSGTGAGTYDERWNQYRSADYRVRDAHSLYIEVLGELGIVGFVLVVSVVLLLLAGFARRIRGPDRVVGAALLAGGVAWAVHAGVDWDWEMPAVTLWIFAAGGLALAREREAADGARVTAITQDLPQIMRLGIGIACLLVAIIPVRIVLSQRALDRSVEAFRAGDCGSAIDHALDASSALSARSDPYLILGYCDVRIGRPDLALVAMNEAVRRDRADWEANYGLAYARAVAGQDPRPRMKVVQRLNPLDSTVFNTARLFASAKTPREWRRRAASARLPFS